MKKKQKLTKILSTLTSLFLMSACAVGVFPAFPDKVKDHYAILVDGEQIPEVLAKAIINIEDIPEARTSGKVNCAHFKITSKVPYQIQYLAFVPVQECNGVGGWKAPDAKLVYNWFEDGAAWVAKHQKCFKTEEQNQ